jgi:hypothetical protein
MARVHATLLEHRGHGPRHYDLVLGTGKRCRTVRLERRRGRWGATPAAPHRRRYLTYRGPVPGGRGSVLQIWHGSARGWCSATGQHWILEPKSFLHSDLRSILRPSPGAGAWTLDVISERVVPRRGTATL